VIDTPVAVLPFSDHSLVARSDHLSESIAQEIVTALSRFRWLKIIGLSATKTLAREGTDALEIGRCLEADYLLTGSTRCWGSQIRIAAELIQRATARTVWADQSSCELASLPEAQCRIAALIAARLERQIRAAETTLAWRTPLDAADARTCVMRAIPLIFDMSKETFGQANTLLQTAIERDPVCASAYAWRAFWQLINIGQQWAKDTNCAVEEIGWLTRVAIERDPEDAYAVALRAHVEAFIHHDYEQALECFDRALKLNPSLGFAWAFSAVTFCYLGKTDEALTRLSQYRQLCPFDPYPFYFNTAYSIAYALSGQYEKAARIGRSAVRENPNYFAAYRPLIASLGHLDQVDEARSYLKKLLANEPHFTIGWLRTKYPPLLAEQFDQYAKGLRRAGVPAN